MPQVYQQFSGKLKLDETVTAIPTISFYVRKVEHNDISINAWVLGVWDKIHPFWKNYYKDIEAVVFVIDSTDNDQIHDAVMEWNEKKKRKRFASVLWQKCQKSCNHRRFKKATWQHKDATKNFDYTMIADRIRTVSWGNDSHPTGEVKLAYGIPTLPLQ